MNYYSHNTIDPNLFAPAMLQRFASVMMMLSKIIGGMHLWRNTLAFHSFHMVHDISMVSEAMPFLFVVTVPVLLAHQSFIEPSKYQKATPKSSSHSFSMAKPQSLKV